MIINELQNKIDFIKAQKQIITANMPHIKTVKYDVFKDAWGSVREYLIVKFDGDSVNVRNCAGDSILAIMDELAKLLHGGYYTELDDYVLFRKDATEIEELSLDWED